MIRLVDPHRPTPGAPCGPFVRGATPAETPAIVRPGAYPLGGMMSAISSVIDARVDAGFAPCIASCSHCRRVAVWICGRLFDIFHAEREMIVEMLGLSDDGTDLLALGNDDHDCCAPGLPQVGLSLCETAERGPLSRVG